MLRLMQQTNGRFTLISQKNNCPLLENLQRHEARVILENRYGAEGADVRLRLAELSLLKLEPAPKHLPHIGRKI